MRHDIYIYVVRQLRVNCHRKLYLYDSTLFLLRRFAKIRLAAPRTYLFACLSVRTRAAIQEPLQSYISTTGIYLYEIPYWNIIKLCR